jgi:hypothetical protein
LPEQGGLPLLHCLFIRLDGLGCRLVYLRCLAPSLPRSPPPPPSTLPVKAQIARDLQQPGAQRTRKVKAIQAAKGAEKGFLGYILGIFRVTQEKIGEAKDRRLVVADQRRPGRFIACLGADDLLGFIHMQSSPPVHGVFSYYTPRRGHWFPTRVLTNKLLRIAPNFFAQ